MDGEDTSSGYEYAMKVVDALHENGCYNGWENFPILFESTELIVYRNPSNEIFVKTISSREKNCGIRITPNRNQLTITSGNGDGILEPSSVRGLPAFVVKPQ